MGIQCPRFSIPPSTRPPTTPSAVPVSPTRMPCARKIRRIDACLSPIASRMPISRVLSRTTIVRVPTTLNAATTQMRNTTNAIASFSSFKAENSEAFCDCQSSARYGGLRLRCARGRRVGAAEPPLEGHAERLRLLRLGQPDLEPGHRGVEPREALRRPAVERDVAVVVLVHAGVEDPRHLVAMELGHVGADARVEFGTGRSDE